MIAWDEVTDDPPFISYTLEMRAVDAAGNVSEPVLIPVRDGSDNSGCALGPAHRGSVVLVGGPLGLLALALRRRRRAPRAARSAS